MKKIHIGFVLLCSIFTSQAFALNESYFVFNPDPSKSRDHLVIPFPKSIESVGDGLTLSVQASNNLQDWGTIQTIHFELSFAGEIQGFVVDSRLQLNESGTGLEIVGVKSKSIYASGFVSSLLNNEALSYVSDGTEEIFIFIGSYTIVDIESERFTLQYLEYTQRSPTRFFRIASSTITVE